MKKTSEVTNWFLHFQQTVNILLEAVVLNQTAFTESNIYISPCVCTASALTSRDYSWGVAIMTLLRVLDKILIRDCCVYESAGVVTQPRRQHGQLLGCEFTHTIWCLSKAAVTNHTIISQSFLIFNNNIKARKWKINTVKKERESSHWQFLIASLCDCIMLMIPFRTCSYLHGRGGVWVDSIMSILAN